MLDKSEIIDYTIQQASALGADMCQARLVYNNKYELNADNRALTLLRTYDTVNLNVTVIKNKRKGSLTIGKTDRESINEGLKTAIANTEHVPEDSALDVMPKREAEHYTNGDSIPDREAIFSELQVFVKDLRQEYPRIRLSTTNNSFSREQLWFGNSNGLRLTSDNGMYLFILTFMAKENLKATSFNFSVTINPKPLGRLLNLEQVQRNLYNSERSIDPKPIPESFTGDLIFSPESCEDFMETILNSISGNALFSKNTPYLDKLGEVIASPELTIVGHPASDEFPAADHFGAYGAKIEKLPIITKGRLDNHLISYYFSKKLNKPLTCDGSPGIEVKPGHLSLEELISNVERGVLLGRFSGGNPNANLDFSGIAKNSFYIEKGKIKNALTETMIAGNIQSLIKSIKGISIEQTGQMSSGKFPFIACTGVDISSGRSSAGANI